MGGGAGGADEERGGVGEGRRGEVPRRVRSNKRAMGGDDARGRVGVRWLVTL